MAHRQRVAFDAAPISTRAPLSARERSTASIIRTTSTPIELDDRGAAVDAVIVLEAPADALVERLSGRRICESCQASYHVVAKPPRKVGICDRCAGALIQRSDDSESIIRNRLREYTTKTKPVIEYFQNHA